MKILKSMYLILLSCTLYSFTAAQDTHLVNTWKCEVLPAEHIITQDSVSGAKVIFVTSDSARDVNLYFDLNCWFEDLSMMIFYSDRRGRYELFAYLTETGEIVRLQAPHLATAGNATADYQTRDIYVIRENNIYQWHIEINLSPDPIIRSTVKVYEREIVSAGEGTYFFSGLTESADGKYLSAGLKYAESDREDIVSVNIQSGQITTLLTRSDISHIQFNKYNPNLLRFSHSPHRMWYIDIRQPGVAQALHPQESGELVTHEDWWVNDQMTFCGGYLDEESHVKLTDIHTQVTRIIGAGSWWPGAKPIELSKYNWWHASGARNGRWVAADNWHGHIAIIDAKSSHLRLLTVNHRPYGDVRTEHPHVGWAPDSKSVEFTSHKRANPDVCIAFLPEQWNNPFVE
jgi:hypothetical protein